MEEDARESFYIGGKTFCKAWSVKLYFHRPGPPTRNGFAYLHGDEGGCDASWQGWKVVGLATPLAKAQLGVSLPGLIRIQGTLFCTINGNSVNGTATPVFPNAAVLLQCGSGNTVVASSITNTSTGQFTILLVTSEFLVSSVLNNCRLLVNTTLATCNVSLGTGLLSSPLQYIGNTVQGLLTITDLVPLVFKLLL
ncbi:hypothetical protein IFM89_024641 [Coptis chinensis]|uniref:Phylloplanin n=1 Tax=Coptis chinensis TaxID=261450 RepID=A0A835H8T1_9MAGN|nr:hypothetical protein IFM89_024641 [Coptis chinensis]